MNGFSIIQPILIHKYSIKTLRPLWIILPFFPLLLFILDTLFAGVLFKESTVGWAAVVILILYLFPLIITVFTLGIIGNLIPEAYLILLKLYSTAFIILLLIGYCSLIAYLLDRTVKSKRVTLSFLNVSVLYFLISFSFLWIFLPIPKDNPFTKQMPVYELREQKQLWQNLISYKDKPGLFDSTYFIRVEYKSGFVKACIDTLDLKAYTEEEIPDEFWENELTWWATHRFPQAKAFVSKRFNFHERGHDGHHYFLYDVPSQRVCYIWYKRNF